MQKTMNIGNKVIGEGQPCFIVAELSANHNQNIDKAKEVIRAAKQAGADAIKLQTYTPDTITINCDNDWFKIKKSNKLWGDRLLYDLYGEAYTPWEWHQELFKLAHEQGLICFSTPFDNTSVDFLESLDAPVYKVASFEVVDIPLLKKIGQTKKPVIMSTGMASMQEIAEAIDTLKNAGCPQIAVLKCTSAYPAPASSMNLKTIPNLADTFNVISGLSDHTMGSAVPIAAVSLGAKIVEKHFMISRSEGGPDSAFSMEVEEFTSMVQDIRKVEEALGSVSYARTPAEQANICFRKSLFIVKDLQAGETLTLDNVRSIRPGYGIAPKYLDNILGKKLTKSVARGTPVSWELL